MQNANCNYKFNTTLDLYLMIKLILKVGYCWSGQISNHNLQLLQVVYYNMKEGLTEL